MGFIFPGLPINPNSEPRRASDLLFAGKQQSFFQQIF
jgi:hypothetical protein